MGCLHLVKLWKKIELWWGLFDFLELFLTGGATYCICKDGLSDSVLQKDIDYACGAGADCSAISQGGSCFNPNTVKDHCNYAVNSFFQKKGQAPGTCDFSGTATPSANPPGEFSMSCLYFFYINLHLFSRLWAYVCFSC